MSSVSYQTWIQQGLKPVDIREQAFFAQASSDFVYTFVEKHWGELLTEALTQAAGQPMQLRLLTQKQAQDWASAPERRPLSSGRNDAGLIPGYTFDTFVVGGANSFAHAA